MPLRISRVPAALLAVAILFVLGSGVGHAEESLTAPDHQIQRLRREADNVEFLLTREILTWDELLSHVSWSFDSKREVPGTFRLEILTTDSAAKSIPTRYFLERLHDRVGFGMTEGYGFFLDVVVDKQRVLFPATIHGTIQKELNVCFHVESGLTLTRQGQFAQLSIPISKDDDEKSSIAINFRDILEGLFPAGPTSISVSRVRRTILLTDDGGAAVRIGLRFPYEAIQFKSFLGEVLIEKPEGTRILFKCFEEGLTGTKVIPPGPLFQAVDNAVIAEKELRDPPAPRRFAEQFQYALQSGFPSERRPLGRDAIGETSNLCLENSRRSNRIRNDAPDDVLRKLPRRCYEIRLSTRDGFGNSSPVSCSDMWMRNTLFEEKVGAFPGYHIFYLLTTGPLVTEPRVHRAPSRYELDAYATGVPRRTIPSIRNDDEHSEQQITLAAGYRRLSEKAPLTHEQIGTALAAAKDAELGPATEAITLLAAAGKAYHVPEDLLHQRILEWCVPLQPEGMTFWPLSMLEALSETAEGRELLKAVVMEPDVDEKFRTATTMVLTRRAMTCIMLEEFSSYDQTQAAKDLLWCHSLLSE